MSTKNLCRAISLALIALCLSTLACHAQEASSPKPAATTNAIPDTYDTDPAADPARPTVTNPAHIPPPGYLQFEQGILQATTTPPGPNHQFSVVQATKISLTYHLMLLALTEPFARSVAGNTSSIDPGDIDVGAQVVLLDENHGHGKIPTIALQFTDRVRAGTSANLDVGDNDRGSQVLAAGDLFGLHYDSNFVVNEQTGDSPDISGHQPPRRAQFGQTLVVTRNLTSKLSLSAEVWRFSQPFISGNAIGNLYALGYTPHKTLVFDAGFSKGLTSSSTHWEFFTGVSYLLPHRLWPNHKK